MVIGEDLLLRKRDLLGVLERVCEGLELTESQFRLAKGRYEAVGAWLADASSPILRTLAIYLQGSTAIGTTVKPINGDEHDVVLHLTHEPRGSGTLKGRILQTRQSE